MSKLTVSITNKNEHAVPAVVHITVSKDIDLKNIVDSLKVNFEIELMKAKITTSDIDKNTIEFEILDEEKCEFFSNRIVYAFRVHSNLDKLHMN